MKKITSLSILMLCGIAMLYAKVRVINIKEVLEEAKHINTVIICGYTDSTMLYRRPGKADTLRIKIWGYKRYREDLQIIAERKKRKEQGGDKPSPDDDYFAYANDGKGPYLAGSWPNIRDTILLVVNNEDHIEVLARKQGDKYRFWTPNSHPLANAIFIINKPFMPLNDNTKDCWASSYTATCSCSDGCLAYIKDIAER